MMQDKVGGVKKRRRFSQCGKERSEVIPGAIYTPQVISFFFSFFVRLIGFFSIFATMMGSEEGSNLPRKDVLRRELKVRVGWGNRAGKVIPDKRVV